MGGDICKPGTQITKDLHVSPGLGLCSMAKAHCRLLTLRKDGIAHQGFGAWALRGHLYSVTGSQGKERLGFCLAYSPVQQEEASS